MRKNIFIESIMDLDGSAENEQLFMKRLPSVKNVCELHQYKESHMLQHHY